MLARILGLVVFASVSWANPVDPVWNFNFDTEYSNFFVEGCAVGDSGYVLIADMPSPHPFEPDSIFVVRVSREGELVWSRGFENELFYPFWPPIIHNNIIWIPVSEYWTDNTAILSLDMQGDSLGYIASDDPQDERQCILLENHAGDLVQFKTVYSDSTSNWQIEYSILNEFGHEVSTVIVQLAGADLSGGVVRANDGYLAIGRTDDYNNLLIRLDNNGQLLWNRRLVYPGDTEQLWSPIQTDDGGFLAVGTIAVPNRGNQGWMVKFSPDGDTIWTKNYGGPDPDYFSAVFETDSGYALFGNYYVETQFGGTSPNQWLFFVDENGDSLSQLIYRTSQNFSAPLYGCIPMDSSYLVYGHNSNRPEPSEATLFAKIPILSVQHQAVFESIQIGDTSELLIPLINSGSNLLIVDSLEIPENFSVDIDTPHEIAVQDTLWTRLQFMPTEARTYSDTLWIINSAFPHRAWIRLYGVSRPLDAMENLLPTSISLLPPYPNPFNATTTIEFELPRSSDVALNVYDVQGRLVTTLWDEVAAAGVHSVRWGCAECASGLYFVRMSAGGFVATQKLLLVK